MFENAVALPVVRFENEHVQSAMQKVNKRFIGFVWMSAWTIFITGLILMLLNPRFVWFQYEDQWSILLAAKQIIFILMIFYGFGYARMLSYPVKMVSNEGDKENTELRMHRLQQFRKMNIFLGIVALLLAMAM